MGIRGFRDRRDAGRRLAAVLMSYANRSDVLVLALPRGGVPVAFDIANALHAPLDVIVVRKLGIPGHEELAMGAIATGGVRVLNTEIIEQLGIPDEVINQVATYEQGELERRERLYRGDRPPYDVHDRTVLLVDDGIATGATIRAAADAIRQRQPRRVIIAVPVAALATCMEFAGEGEELVCLIKSDLFFSVSSWYRDFTPTTDEEVRDLLARQYSGGQP
jgi:putative phosphoribosyl transferase